MRFTFVSGLAAALLVVPVPFAVHADLPSKHPFYLHSLSDLRSARWMLEHRPGNAAVSGQEDVAITEIDRVTRKLREIGAFR